MEMLITLGGFVVLFFAIRDCATASSSSRGSVRAYRGDALEPANFAPPASTLRKPLRTMPDSLPAPPARRP